MLPPYVCVSGERGKLKVVSFCFLLVSSCNLAFHRVAPLCCIIAFGDGGRRSPCQASYGYATALIWSSTRRRVLPLAEAKAKGQDGTWWGQKEVVTDQL
jgi:hypothetical protein